MHYVARTVRGPTSVVSAVKSEYKRKPCLFVNKGKEIEVRDMSLKLVETIHPNSYMTLIIPVAFKEMRGLLMIDKTGEYVMAEDGYAVSSGKMPITSCYTRYAKSSRYFIFIAEDSTVAVASICNDELVFDQSVNDFNYYKILECLCHQGDFMFLLKDICDDVFLARYGTNPVKTGIYLREKTLLRRGIRFMGVIDDGFVFIGNEKIYYYAGGKFVFESEFANPEVRSSVLVAKGMILSMEDGELIRVLLRKAENATVERVKSSTNEEKGDLAFDVEVLGNTNTWFSAIVHLEKDLYYGGSSFGCSCYMKVGSKMKILKEFENDSCPVGLQYTQDSFRYITKKHTKKITYGVDLDTVFRHDFPHKIKLFGIFEDHFIVSYADEGNIFGPSMTVEKSFREILNVHTNGCCYFNTRDHLFRFRNKNIIAFEEKRMVLSSYYGARCAVFTEDRVLKMICLKTMSCVVSTTCPYEVCLLLLSEYLFLSTYDDEFVVMDAALNLVHRRKWTGMRTTCMVGTRVFFGDMVGWVYEAVFRSDAMPDHKNKTEAHNARFDSLVFEPLCLMDFVAESLVPVQEYIMVIGKSSAFINISSSLCYRCSFPEVSCAFFSNQLYVSAGKTIFKCTQRQPPGIKVSTRDPFSGEKSHRTRLLRFSANMGCEEIIGSAHTVLDISEDAVINSYLTLKVAEKTHEVFLPNELIMDGRFLSKHCFVVVSNIFNGGNGTSKLSMFSTKNERLKAVYEDVNEGVSHTLDADGDYVVTHRGANLCVYKKQAKVLVELCVTKIDFLPYKITICGERIACACDRKALGVFMFNRETNHLSLDFFSTGKIKAECVAFLRSRALVGTTDGTILLLSKEDPILECLFSERITSVRHGSLSLHKNNTFYFTTESGRIGVLAEIKLGDRDFDMLVKLENYANEQSLFVKEATESIINVDMINTMSKHSLDVFSRENGCRKEDLIKILSKINEVY